MLSIKELYLSYKEDVFHYLVGLTGDVALSEDLVSETFLAAITSLARFRGDSSLKTWLFSLARHKWYDHLRNKKKRELCFNNLVEIYFREEKSLEGAFERKAIADKIRELLDQEEERARKIVLLRIEGYSFYEIANKLAISESSARVIDFRTKKKIRNILQREGLKNG